MRSILIYVHGRVRRLFYWYTFNRRVHMGLHIGIDQPSDILLGYDLYDCIAWSDFIGVYILSPRVY